ncbi:MAG: putative 3-hydroxybutyryl-CoA dehydrogenase [Verrucomicrobiota bacterium]
MEASRTEFVAPFMSTAPSLNPWFPTQPAGATPIKPLRAIGIIGTDKTGAGIAQWCATKRMGVMMHDVEAGALTQAVQVIRGLFKSAEERHEISGADAHKAMGGISITTSLEDMEFCDIIIDTLTEDTASKVARFARLAKVLPPEALLATCASSAGLQELAAGIPGPDRLIGLLFFDPVNESRQVHVTLGKGTSRLTAERTLGFIDTLGKQAMLQGPVPGANA